MSLPAKADHFDPCYRYKETIKLIYFSENLVDEPQLDENGNNPLLISESF